ncbi:MAG: methyltransferase domain-containing protein [Candidatus Margulisiibacteriota bacterium]|jgi:SAM-dependent methyltransferase
MYLLNKHNNPIFWLPASEGIYWVIRTKTREDKELLEIGAGSGHISYLLAKKGYKIIINDVRKDCVNKIKLTYKLKNIRAKYIYGSLFDIKDKFDFVWNTGLVQCFSDKKKNVFIKHLAKISDHVLLFYPDTESKNKILGKDSKKIPGVGDAKEYSISNIPDIFLKYFSKIEIGVLDENKIKLPYKMYWLYANNKI